MEKFDWRVPLKPNITMLKIVGLWPAGNESYKLDLYTFYSIICITCFVVGYFSIEMYSIVTSLDDFAAVAVFIGVDLFLFLGLLKTYCIISNMRLLKSLMTDINDGIFQPKSKEQKNLCKTGLSSWQKMYKMYHILTVGSIFTFSTLQIIENFEMHERRLYVQVKTPYDSTSSPVFELTYLYLLLSDLFMGMVNLDTDTLIAALNTFIAIQCDILCDDLRHIQNSKNIEKNLIKCIQHHKAILTFAEKSNKFFNWLVFAQFAISVFLIAFLLLQMTRVDIVSSDFFSHVVYLSVTTTQIFVCCWFGNKTDLQSRKIPGAILQSDWIGAPLYIQKNILIFVSRTQKPIKMSAFKFFYLTLDTFLNIIRMGYSYFAVLKEVNA